MCNDHARMFIGNFADDDRVRRRRDRAKRFERLIGRICRHNCNKQSLVCHIQRIDAQ